MEKLLNEIIRGSFQCFEHAMSIINFPCLRAHGGKYLLIFCFRYNNASMSKLRKFTETSL